MILNRKILFLQFLSNILIICLVLLTIRKTFIDINFIYFIYFIVLITCIDMIFLVRSIDSSVKSFIVFNFSRYLVFFIGYLIFYFAYYYPNNEVISVITPEEYFDSGMYVYVAKNLANGLLITDTDFVLYHGTQMSPNWALIVYIYTGFFLIFGIEEQILPTINFFLYSYLFFFFVYIFEMTNLKKNQIYLISLFMILLPGPIYWVASLSKEVIYYCFLALIFYFILSDKKRISIRIILISFVASFFSRFNIIAIVFFSKIQGLIEVNTKKEFIKNLFKIYILILITFIVGVFIFELLFGIDFFKSTMYIPGAANADELWGSKMDFVPMSISELFYKLPIKIILTVFSESNIVNVFNYPFGNTNSYATLFNTLQGVVRIINFSLVILFFFIIKRIPSEAYKFMLLTFIFYMVFSISIGFFQSRYLIFGDYLLIFSLIFIFTKNKRVSL